jgi:hypothetical protein
MAARDRIAKARRCGLSAILPGLERNVMLYLDHFQHVAGLVAKEPTEHINAPSVRFFFAELRQIEADFGGISIDLKAKTVSVMTDPITLEEVELGSFEVCLPWEDAVSSCNYQCFDIVAVNPNPPDVDDNVTHPHVKRKKLCAGDAVLPIKRALEQGRLADAFSLVHSVLTTYNPDSPHVRLSEWNGTKCNDCGYSIPSDDANYCEGCHSDVCNDCASTCSICGYTRCLSCLEACGACHRSCCTNCLIPIPNSTIYNCCPDCFCKCSRCKAVFAKKLAEQKGGLCSACRSRSSVVGTAANAVTTIEPEPFSSDEEPNHATSLEPDAAPITA